MLLYSLLSAELGFKRSGPTCAIIASWGGGLSHPNSSWGPGRGEHGPEDTQAHPGPLGGRRSLPPLRRRWVPRCPARRMLVRMARATPFPQPHGPIGAGNGTVVNVGRVGRCASAGACIATQPGTPRERRDNASGGPGVPDAARGHSEERSGQAGARPSTRRAPWAPKRANQLFRES